MTRGEAPIDWPGLEWALITTEGARDRDYCFDHGGATFASDAIARLLGRTAMRDAVDVSVRDGSLLVRRELALLHPWPAMERCHEIFDSDAPLDQRRSAVELLNVVADHRALPWIPLYLADPDPMIRQWGLRIVDELLGERRIDPQDAAELLAAARDHGDPDVRDVAAQIELDHDLR
jgi:hypothetical protein